MYEVTALIMPCACGGYVSAYRTEPMAGLLAHYRSNQHRCSAWGRAVDQAQPDRPTADPYDVDLSGVTPGASAGPAGKP